MDQYWYTLLQYESPLLVLAALLAIVCLAASKEWI